MYVPQAGSNSGTAVEGMPDGIRGARGGYPWTRHLQDCSRSGPGVDQLVALPNELEAEGIGADSKFRDGWVCLGCFNRGVV